MLIYSSKLLNCSFTLDSKASGHLKNIFLFSSAGRTFPTHPYFSAQLGAGQLSLFNLLKAYSLLDKEVGYCQGISFVAGVLLLHMSEEQAFEMLKFLMYDLGFRKQYRPDMMSLQVSGGTQPDPQPLSQLLICLYGFILCVKPAHNSITVRVTELSPECHK